MQKYQLKFFISFLIIFIISSTFFYLDYKKFIETPLNIKVPFIVARRLGDGASLLSPVWEELQNLNPNGEYLTYPEAGHPVIFTEAKEFAKDVLNFINKL